MLDSVIFISTLFRRSAFLLKSPLEVYCSGVVSSVCKSISALQVHCTKVVSYVHDVLCPGVGPTLVHRFKHIFQINTHWQGEMIITYFLMSLFVQKSKTILVWSLHMSKTEVMCWLHCFWVNCTAEECI